jgi:hypothetical protein
MSSCKSNESKDQDTGPDDSPSATSSDGRTAEDAQKTLEGSSPTSNE